MTTLTNKEIRILLRFKDIPMWQLAKQIGISEPTITRWFRTELTSERYKKIVLALSQITGTDLETIIEDKIRSGVFDEHIMYGQWVKISPAGIYECSMCGKQVCTADIGEYVYCHGCGHPMINYDW